MGLQQNVATLLHLVGNAVEPDGGQDEGAAAVQAGCKRPAGERRY